MNKIRKTERLQVEDLARMSLNKPVRLFINENTATAANLKQEFVRIREERESDREAIVAGKIADALQHTH